MAVTLNQNTDCCETSCTSTTVNVPGQAGTDGEDGAAGAAGVNAYTTTSGTFVVPSVNATVTPVAVASSSWASIGQVIFVSTAGYYEVTAKPSGTSLTLKNLYASPTNAAAGVTIATSQTVSPAGLKGDTGATGAAASSLPSLAKGSLLTNNGSGNVALAVGSGNTKFLGVDSTAATGMAWETVNYSDLTGTLALNTVTTSGQLPLADIANAGGAAGDVAYWDGSNWVRLAKGSTGQVLEQGASAPQWATQPGVNLEAMGRVTYTHSGTSVAYNGTPTNCSGSPFFSSDEVTITFTTSISSSFPIALVAALGANAAATSPNALYVKTISTSSMIVKVPATPVDKEFSFAVFA